MDRSVSPGTDFFLYANGAWLKSAAIPADRSGTGAGLRVEQIVEERTKAILDEGLRAPPGSDLRKIGDFYATYLDEAAIESRGLEPLKAKLATIANLKDVRELSAYFGGQLRADVDPLNNSVFHTPHVLGLWVEQDLNEPTRYAPYLLQGGLGLPERTYYLGESGDMQALRKKYVAHLASLARLAGLSDPEGKAGRVFALEKKIAQSHVAREDSDDVGKANNAWGRTDFVDRAPGLDWEAFFNAAGLGGQSSFIVWHPHALTALASLANSEPIETWKEYLTVRAIAEAAPYLTRALADEAFAFEKKELEGIQTKPPRWRDAVDATNEAIGQAVGKVYVERYFPPESKKAVQDLVRNLVTEFGKRIDKLDWMAPETKAKAKEKLATLRVGIGYPDRWIDYAGLEIVRGDLLGNVERARLFDYQRNVGKLRRPVDRDEWAMLPHVVNAVNLPVRNALNFPAGILSPPFFDPRATAAANYGAIGATIGHEISHSFDDQGAKFDAHGRYANWWTKDDLARFEASGAALAAQFSAYKPLPGLAVNGKQTLSENIADLAGLGVAYDAWRASLHGEPAPAQDGFSGEEQFFVAFAQSWQEKERDERLRDRLLTDGHAPPHYRVLTVRNLDPWYAAFGVKEGAPLYLKADARVRVW
jgi:putative endopeptidase